MAYVGSHKHDIFLSYARVDDQPLLPGAAKGWVTEFAEILKKRVEQLLGRKGCCDLWMDHEISHHEGVTPQITEALSQSALLLVVLSPGYLASKWCGRELKAFLRSVAGDVRAGARAFPVEMDVVDDVPNEFSDLKRIEFWVQTRSGPAEEPAILDPRGTEAERGLYIKRIDILAREMVGELRSMARRAPAGDDPHRTPGSLPRDYHVPEGEPVWPAVFLAEVTDDLEEERDGVQSYLDQKKVKALPANLYPREASAFWQAAEKDLEGCELFVQLLSGVAGKTAPGGSKTYARLQYEVALQSKKQILQWRSRNLDLAHVRRDDHLDLLEGETVRAEGIEELKRAVWEAVSAARRPPQRPVRAYVFVSGEPGERDVARGVCDELERLQVDYAVRMRDGSPEDIRQDLAMNIAECQVFVLIYTRSTRAWVRKELMLCRKVVARLDSPVKTLRTLATLAVYCGPPEGFVDIGMKVGVMKTVQYGPGVLKRELEPLIQDQ